MEAYRRILLYGNSVILGSIGACLRRCSQFEVMTLDTILPEMEVFHTIKPDIVLFDLEASTTESVFHLLKTNPALLLIGINPGTNLIRVWNSRQLQDMSMKDLFKLIKRGAIIDPDSPSESPVI